MIGSSKLNNLSRIFVTGGTGSFGKAFISRVFQTLPDVERVVAQQFPPDKYPNIRFFIGDVRDKDRIKRAMEGIDTVVHAAALKQVPTAEYNPFECIKTNVLGAQNLIEAILDSDVRRVVALSTDKAAAPINLYGATKLCSDKLFVAANNMKGHRDVRFSAVRYGNVMGSRGSVIPFFLDRRKTGILPITDPRMTRFNISLPEGVDLVLHALDHALGGEIFVPKIPSYRITDVAEAIGPECAKPVVGIRPGEKLHEEMITHSDSPNTLDCEKCYVIVPSLVGGSQASAIEQYAAHHHGTLTEEDFRYSSGKNTEWLSVDQIRQLIVQHVDSTFTV